jgi:raffinose/stachyose/melibiose transport system permease protein
MEKEQPSSASHFGIVPLYFAILWLIIAVGPFLFQVVTTFKTSGEFSSGSLFQLPQTVQFGNYVSVFSDGLYRYFFNSVIVLAVALTLLLLFSAFAAYPLSRMEFKLNKPIYSAIVAAMSIPIHITLIPIFVMTNYLDIYDNMLALIGPNVAFNLPVSVFILTGFMRGISKEMEEAAEIDGCGKFATFFRILLPLSKPGLATIAIYNGVVIWNEFIFVMTLTGSKNAQTLPMAIWQYQGQYSFDVPKVMTVLVLTSLPMILFYIFGQDKLVKGMMAGAVKG